MKALSLIAVLGLFPAAQVLGSDVALADFGPKGD